MNFRPKIQNIISEKNMSPAIIIPKNSGLKDIVSTTLAKMGLNFSEFKRQSDDIYYGDDLAVYIYRAEDIPGIVEQSYQKNQTKVLGFTGDDLFDEYKINNPNTLLSLIETIDWDDDTAKYRRPALCLIGKNGVRPKGKVSVAVNKKYEATSRKAIDELKESLEIEPTINLYGGNLEQTVVSGLNDYCIDIVYSGKTLEEKNLSILDTIRFSDFVMIGVDESNPAIFKLAYNKIQDRINNPVPGSYTAKLAASWNTIIKKVGEETAEFIKACAEYSSMDAIAKDNKLFGVLLNNAKPEDLQGAVSELRNEFAGEFCDKMYTAYVALAMAKIPFERISQEEYRRFKQ